MKFYLPVFGYKPSFDMDKRDKHKMEVHYVIPVDQNGNIGDTIPQPRPRRAAVAVAGAGAGANNDNDRNAAAAAADPFIQN